MNYDEAPSWLKAADAHSIASDNSSIFDDVTSALGKTPSFLAVSVASGLNSFYNTGVAVSNIFEEEGNKSEMRDTAEWISEHDEDLGKYYQEVQQGADIVGFIAGSLVPGTAAVKGLNAAQRAARVAEAGVVGSNYRWATNLLAPAMETYVKREAGELAARSAAFSFMHQNSLKSLGSYAWQGALEGAAFETAVAATMFKSPLLEDMDVGDMIKNGMMFGVGLGAGVGGIIGAARTYFGVGSLLKRADQTAMQFGGSTQATTSRMALPSDKIMNAAWDLENLGNMVPTPEFVVAQKLAAGETGESLLPHIVAGEVEKLGRIRTANMDRLRNEIRTASREMASDDVLGNILVDVSDKLGTTGLQKVFYNSKQFVRAGDQTDLDKMVKDLVKAGAFKDAASARKALSSEAINSHIRLHSGNVGDEIAGKVGVHRLADDFTPNQLEDLIKRTPFKHSSQTDFRKALTPREAELRWIAARSSGLPFKEGAKIHAHDLPALEKAWRDNVQEIEIVLDNNATMTLHGSDAIKEQLVVSKAQVIEAQKELGVRSDVTEIISDVKLGFIEGTLKGDDLEKTFFAQADYAAEASQFYGREITPVQLARMPRFAKVLYDNKTVLDEDGMIMKGMKMVKHREKLAKMSTDNYFAKYAQELGQVFPTISEDLLRTMWRGETGAGTFTNAGGAYGSMSSMTSYIGNLVGELSKIKISALNDDMARSAQRLLESPQDAVRFSGINAIVTNAKVKYVVSSDGTELVPYQVKKWLDEGGDAGEFDYPQLPEGTVDSIPLETPAIRDAVIKHIELSDKRNTEWGSLAAVQGNTNDRMAGVFRPIRPDARDYKHVAFVKDESITGVGHTRMIFAKDAAELEDMIAKVNGIGKYKVYTRQQAEDFYKARGEWEYDKTLHENYIDHDLLSRGISSNFIPPTDPGKVVNTWLQQHTREENALLKQSVVVKYEKEINELKRLGEQWGLASGSRVGYKSVTEMLTSADKNPYTAMIKAMLNVTKTEEIPLLTTLNQTLDHYVSKAWNSATAAFAKGPSQANVDMINDTFQELGFQSAYQDSATALMANSKVPRGVLTGFVRKANAFLTTTMLRLDAFNALTNLVGNSVLYSTELKVVTDAIKKGSKEGAGELAALGNIKLPGVGDEVLSPAKLMANAIKRLHGPDSKALVAEYEKRGLAPDLTEQYYKALDSMTLTGMETVQDMTKLTAKLDQAWENFAKTGEKWTGNKFAEKFNRLIAIDTMKQITEVAVKHGVMDEKAAWMYVNTFSNRVNGVIRAAERPLMFQGPIGQAIGLFQSYQMNLMQQLFRHIGEGRGKSVAMMAGLQSSMFGASSLPGFNLINNTLVGDASGNKEHYDLHSASQMIFGRTGSDWLMYGAPSNILRASLYTRGDTNPRTWHVVPNPTNPSEIPFISAFAKAFSSIKDATGQMKEGAPLWGSFLTGIEHLGLSRPLAGLAQTARALDGGDVISTQKNGSIAGSNDFFTMATLIRLAGSKPIDEAIVTNSYFRINSYAEKDRERRERLGTTVKGMIMGGGEIDSEAVSNFAQRYVELGGSATGFNSWWMSQYKNTSQTQSEQMVRKLDDPYARRMMEVMGGRDSLNDLESY